MGLKLPVYESDYAEILCGSCGIQFYVPSHWKKNRIESKGEYHCPNGHTRVYCGETEADKLRRELNATTLELGAAVSSKQFAEQRLQNEQKRHQRELGRIHKRAHAGVCQLCHRTFQNVARHMKTKHSEKS